MKRHYTLSGLLLCLMTLFTLSASAQPDKNYLCFTANTARSEVMLIRYGTPTAVTIEYSTDGTNWNDYPINKLIKLANVDDKVYFRNAKPASEVTGFSKGSSNNYHFDLEGSIAASGNVMSLVDVNCATTTIPCDYCFSSLFEGCEELTSAPELPATTLAARCYDNMFYGCISLTTAPELPATTLADYCYYCMFYRCSALTTAPELPATTLASHCCHYMFQDCTSLTTAPELPATTLADRCYFRMFYGCSKLKDIKVAFTDWSFNSLLATNYWMYNVAADGTFSCPEGLEKTTGVTYVPTSWTTIKNTYDLTISDKGWASLCVNLPLEVPTGAEVYYAKSVQNNTITLKQIEAGTVMAPRTAVIVKADASTTVQFPIAGEDGTSYENLFQGSSVDKAKTEDVYVLSGASTADKPIFQPYTGTTLGAHKIWLPKSAVGGASSIQFRFADATAISSVETEVAEDVIYNLAGQRVGSDYRGIVIKNGKKNYNK